ncbi:MAG: LytTR family DNA-binding domain-containing protein [Bacteroidota bacterium]
MTTIAIIEDEFLAQEELKQMLEQLQVNVEVAACLRSVSQSVSWLKENAHSIDLIFADIELLDGQCFKIFEEVEVDIPVIFLTAYDAFALKAFKLNSIDYLLKPIESDALRSAFEKYQRIEHRRSNISIKDIQQLLQRESTVFKDRFSIKVGDTYKHLPVADVAYFQSEEKMVYAVSKAGQKYIVDLTLNDLEQKLDPKLFFRASRKYLVQIHAVEKAVKYFNSRLKLILIPKPEEDVLISRVRVPDFLKWLNH